MPSSVRLHRLVHADAEDVFGVLADPWSYARWVSGTATIRAADRDWPAVGSRLHHRFGPWPLRSADYSEVLECVPGRRLVLQARARPLGDVRAVLELRPAGPHTMVTLSEELLGGWSARLGVLATVVQWLRNRRSLHQLARLAEQRSLG